MGETVRSVQENGLALVESRFRRGSIVPRHHHTEAYISFLFAGSYVELLSSRKRRCSAATVVWHPPNETHEVHYESDGHILNLAVEPAWLKELPTDVTLGDRALAWEGGLPYRFGLQLYCVLNRDARISDECAVDLISWCAPDSREHIQFPWLARVQDWMHEEHWRALTLAQAAEVAGVHSVHVSRSFRRRLGCTFREYLTLIRLRNAMELMKQRSTGITEVAFACGFSDHAHFTRAFKRATGLTPTAYRSQSG